MTFDNLSNKRSTAVETFIADWLTQHRIPGAAVAIVDADGDPSVSAEGFGARTLETNTPVTADTLFGVGSCTKPFTATAIMQLVEAGDLAVDDPVSEYLPHLADAPGDLITIEELLTHTSGMPSDGAAGPLITRWLGVGGGEIPLSSEADFRRHVQGSTDRRVTDRETFFYYNSGYIMLGQIIEQITGQDFSTYVEEEILAPLGMDRATFDQDAFEADSNRMTPYMKQEGASTEAGFPFDPLIHPAGGLIASVRDLAKYMQGVFGGTALGADRVVTAKSLEMMTKHVGSLSAYFDGQDLGYGYGFMMQEFLDDRWIGHGGSIGVSTAWFGYLEDADVGVAVACTTSPETHPMDAGMAVMGLLQDKTPETVQPHYRLMSTLEAVTGKYAGYRNTMGASVERVGGGLKIEVDGAVGGQELLLTPTRIEDDLLVCTTVTAAGTEREIRFEFGDGNVDLFVGRLRLRHAA